MAHGVGPEAMAQCFAGGQPLSFDQFFALMRRSGGKSPSTLRISVGLATNFSDVYRFVRLASGFLDRTVEDLAGTIAALDHGPAGPDTA
jgi:molybdenum cofactor sulfurtransferase